MCCVHRNFEYILSDFPALNRWRKLHIEYILKQDWIGSERIESKDKFSMKLNGAKPELICKISKKKLFFCSPCRMRYVHIFTSIFWLHSSNEILRRIDIWGFVMFCVYFIHLHLNYLMSLIYHYAWELSLSTTFVCLLACLLSKAQHMAPDGFRE